MGVNKETVHFLVGQKKLEDDYKHADMLPNIGRNNGVHQGIPQGMSWCHPGTFSVHYKEFGNSP